MVAIKYFIDTEFIEDGKTIDLISIGIVAEDGREYYAETYALHHPEIGRRIRAHEWLMANVVPHLAGTPEVQRAPMELRDEIRYFVYGPDPKFWGYCSAYDWVVLNQLYGSMVDHPRAWEFYCHDIAQFAEDNGINRRLFPKQHLGAHGAEHNALADARWTRDTYNWIRGQLG